MTFQRASRILIRLNTLNKQQSRRSSAAKPNTHRQMDQLLYDKRCSANLSEITNLGFALAQIIVATGAKPLLADIIRAMASDGDEIVMAAPCWPSHVGMVELAGATPVFVTTTQDDGFVMDPDRLSATLGKNTRGIILCAPSNPTGAVYSSESLLALAEVLRRHPDIWIITDGSLRAYYL